MSFRRGLVIVQLLCLIIYITMSYILTVAMKTWIMGLLTDMTCPKGRFNNSGLALLQ